MLSKQSAGKGKSQDGRNSKNNPHLWKTDHRFRDDPVRSHQILSPIRHCPAIGSACHGLNDRHCGKSLAQTDQR